MRDDRESMRNMGTMVALCGLVFLSLGLIALMALVLPQVLGVAIVVGMFSGAVAFHYLVWGWWMSAQRPPDEPPTES